VQAGLRFTRHPGGLAQSVLTIAAMNRTDLIRWSVAALLAATLAGHPALAAEPTLALKTCRLPGVEHDARCGVLRRPLDPARADGPQIDLHVAVLPAVARHKKPDPVLFFAGGPGQSAIELAGPVERLLGRFLNRRDVILIDQRGTGRSAPLTCGAEPPTRPLKEALDLARQARELAACRTALQALPHGDLRQYTTSIAMADAEAVRRALGAGPVNVIGGSYGTRAALEYMRQFPASVRRAVIDGVAPPDMALPGSFSPDAQAALEGLLAACEAEPACRGRYPGVRAQWRAVLAGLPRELRVNHPVTGREETLTLTRDMLVSLVRLPLYAPVLASALPFAISEAAAGRHTALIGLAVALQGGKGTDLAMGMHYSVVCAEDLPRLATTPDRPGADFGDMIERIYRAACAEWPRGTVPPAFYSLPPAPAPTLLLSGSADPVTPPRHGERVARALGALARHVVVPNAGHGTLALGCLRDVVYRFVDAEEGAAALAALQGEAACVAHLPRPPAFAMPTAPAASPGNDGPLPSFLDPLGGPDAKRQVWGRSGATP
jgi:pimeloyl-ACP methyl ester carboxylesterase